MERVFDRRVPGSWEHYEKYPLSAVPLAEAPARPVTIGVNWYGAFDQPELVSGRWWIGRGALGKIRGGHCVCLKTALYNDLISWWDYYNQGVEGACVGAGSSRMMSLLNRVRYNWRWLYHEAQKVDEWPGESYEGTSVNAAMKVLAARGAMRSRESAARLGDGIAAYRWASTVDEIRGVLRTPFHDKLQAVPMLNSWGRSYPHVTWLPYTVLERLLAENGEAVIVTDR